MSVNDSFQTDRLTLRPVSIDDAPFIYDLMNSAGWLQFIGDRNIGSVMAAEKYIRERMFPQFNRLGFGNYTIISKSDNNKIGTVGLFDRDGVNGIDLGFALLPEFEGFGYAYEAAKRLQQAACEDFGLDELSAITTKDNSRSQQLLKRLAFETESSLILPNDTEELLLFKWKNPDKELIGKIFKYSKVLRIITSILGALLIFAGMALLGFAFFDYESLSAVKYVFIPMGVILLGLAIMGLLEVYKTRFIIGRNELTRIAPFYTRVLKFNEIKGTYERQSNLEILPKNARKKKLMISEYIKGYAGLSFYLRPKFPNYNVMGISPELDEIYNNESYGATMDDRKNKYIQNSKIVKRLNLASWIISIVSFFISFYIEFFIFILIPIPLFGIFLFWRLKGMIPLLEIKKTDLPSFSSNLLVPSLGLSLKPIFLNDILSFQNFWMPALIIVLVLTAFTLAALINTMKNHRVIIYLSFAIIINSMYAYGTTLIINHVLDKSEAKVYKTVVLDKRIEYGKYTNYYIKIDKWGPQSKIKDIDVDKTFYNQTEIGDRVIIILHQGFFKIPYYNVYQ
ncbi:MAG TPA: GNAT family N-acetyltransferase [Bacteroidales bacterium]|nr:GNAT family N-acetyltransferase [Bacteroidales bacterium]HRX97959.1 GNAT family N-acetyltransferase [Bacteroidales bacterium]